MSWTLYEVSDDARFSLAGLKIKSEWYDQLGKLNIGSAGTVVCDLTDTWPLWIEATEHAPYPLDLLFTGELSARGGADPDVGFLGSNLVQAIADALNQPESFFLGLLASTEFAQFSENFRSEIALLPMLRNYYGQVSARNNATIFLLA